MKKLRGSAILMIVAILGITGFQGYWLKNNYDREKQSLDLKTKAAFRQTILSLQASKLKLDKFTIRDDSMARGVVTTKKISPVKIKRTTRPAESQVTLLNILQEKIRDSIKLDSPGRKILFINISNDSLRKVFIDSIKKKDGRLIITHRMDSSLPPRAMIREVHLDKTIRDEESGMVTMDFNSKPPKPKNVDSIIANRESGVVKTSYSALPDGKDVLEENPDPGGDPFIQLIHDVDSIALIDSVRVDEISNALSTRFKEENIQVGFMVSRIDSTQSASPDAVTIGIRNPQSFELSLQNTMRYMWGKLKLPIFFSLLLVGITVASFVLLYRNLLKQRRLAEAKNEFISNITHELKTPIATVGVAIEALKNFNAIDDPRRTQEYLSISQNELQRLNLLVDKVLKLSMFEKKEVELKYEMTDLKDIVNEVVTSMRLQIEKYHGEVMVRSEGDTVLRADRLHLLSVLFNLLDNALKYSQQNPQVDIAMKGNGDQVQLTVTDKGIGIAEIYHKKIFDKFFRIPHGDTHNAKGYGLGLSYVAHVIRKHNGSIRVESHPGNGTTFIITLPKAFTQEA